MFVSNVLILYKTFKIKVGCLVSQDAPSLTITFLEFPAKYKKKQCDTNPSTFITLHLSSPLQNAYTYHHLTQIKAHIFSLPQAIVSVFFEQKHKKKKKERGNYNNQSRWCSLGFPHALLVVNKLVWIIMVKSLWLVMSVVTRFASPVSSMIWKMDAVLA